jgi:PAS domain S-box-containing protein
LYSPGSWSILESVLVLTLSAGLLLGALLLTFAWRRERNTHVQAPPSDVVERLAESEGRFQSLSESLPLMVWTCKPEGPCDYLSPQWIAYTGVSEAEQLGYGWLNQLHPEDVSRTQAEWAKAAESGTVFDTEYRIRRHDGEYRWFKTRAIPTKSYTGKITQWVGTNVDIQNLKETTNDRMTTLAVQLQTAQRVANVGSFDFILSTGIVHWSDELYRTFGMEPNETPPPFSEQAKLFNAESWARLQAAVAHSVEAGEGYELVLTAIRVDGEHRICVARAEVMRGASGKVERLVGTFQDITSRERIVAEHKALSERLQLATSAGRIGVWEWDIQRGALNWDASMRRIFGCEQADFEPTFERWMAAVHPDDRESIESLMREVLAGRGQFRALFRIVRPNGEIRHVQADAVMTRDARGRAQNMTGVNWDVTDQQVAELALRGAEAMQRAILSSAGSAIIATDSETGLIRSFNRAAEELLGYSAEEVVGKATPAQFHEPAELRVRRASMELELGHRVERAEDLFFGSAEVRSESREWTYIRKDGTRVPVLLTVSAIRDSAQQVIGYLAVAADLSMRKQYEAELLSLNKLLEERTEQAESASYAKGMFLANMSHEIRTPIGAITGASYLLGRTKLSEEQHDLLSTIERSATVLLGMVNDVLDLSKIEARQLVLDNERFELPALLDDLASLMHAYASGKNIELILDVEPQLPSHFFGDRLRLTQVLTNLAVNAIKFTERGSVRLVVRRIESDQERTRLRFEVHDTGLGIDEATQRRLFKPFSQAEMTGARRFGGTGLGLAIVKELVTLMDGSVGLSSQKGQGSLFWCEVPLSHAPASLRPGAIGSDLRVLIIEDYEAQRDALLRCAAQLGFRAVAAASGEQGLALLLEAAREQRPFDLVLVDWRMPTMSGLRVLEVLRTSTELGTSQPSVILTTAYELAALQAEPLARLADAILAKPLAPSTLMDTVLRVVSARAPDRVSGPVKKRPSLTEKRLNGVRILVADDSEINRTIARRILELEGAKVSLACDGSEAVFMVVSGEHELDVVLMDIQMPTEDGVQATRRIRSDERFLGLPILALTAGALASERERALAAGMADFITKPYAPDDLIAKVREHVSVRQEAAQPAPAAPTSEVSQVEWDEVEGFATSEARQHLGADAGLFRLLVTRLGEEMDEDPVARQPRDLAVCSAWLHRLAGSAGILSATGLHRAARDAEVALHKGGEVELERHCARLYEEMARTRRGIQAITRWSKPARPQVEKHDPELLGRFMQCVRERDLQAFTMFSEVEAQLGQQLPAADCQRLQAAIQRLDFASASEILRPLEQAPKRAAQG